MNTILKNIVSFSGLPIGVPVSLPHRLNVNGTPVLPQLVFPQQGGVAVAANTMNITATRQAGGPANVNVYAEHWHTIESVTPLVPPPGKLVGLAPFIFQPGSGGGGGSNDNPMYLPESWIGRVSGVHATSPIHAAVGDGSTGQSVKTIRAGSLVGFLVRLSSIGVTDAGTYTFTVTINGAPTSLVVVCTASSNQFGGRITQAPGIDTYVSGNHIGVTGASVGGDEEGGVAIISSLVEAFEVLP